MAGGAICVGRDPRRPVLWRAAGALVSYAIAVAAWTVSPDSRVAQILLCVPALGWAGAAVGLLPDDLPERRRIDRGWLVLAVIFLITVVALPAEGRLVVLAPLVGGLILLWRFQDKVRPRMLPAAVTAAAVLYGFGLVVMLVPIDLGSPGLVLAAMGLDLLRAGLSGGGRRRGRRRRAPAARPAPVGRLRAGRPRWWCGGLATLTMLAAPGQRAVLILQFLVVAAVMAYGRTGRARPAAAWTGSPSRTTTGSGWTVPR